MWFFFSWPYWYSIYCIQVLYLFMFVKLLGDWYTAAGTQRLVHSCWYTATGTQRLVFFVCDELDYICYTLNDQFYIQLVYRWLNNSLMELNFWSNNLNKIHDYGKCELIIMSLPTFWIFVDHVTTSRLGQNKFSLVIKIICYLIFLLHKHMILLFCLKKSKVSVT